jgi:hypothetical protein
VRQSGNDVHPSSRPWPVVCGTEMVAVVVRSRDRSSVCTGIM